MRDAPKQVHSLCPDSSECPAVEIDGDGTVHVGEAPNLVTLKRAEWNELVRAIRRGELAEIS